MRNATQNTDGPHLLHNGPAVAALVTGVLAVVLLITGPQLLALVLGGVAVVAGIIGYRT